MVKARTKAFLEDGDRRHKETCEKLILAELSCDKAVNARDEEEKKCASLDAKLKESISNLVLVEGNLSKAKSELESLHLSHEKELESHLKMGFDDVCFHILRCMRAHCNIYPDLKELEKWILKDQDDPLLQVYHSDLPYSDRLMKDFQDSHVLAEHTMWDPPAVNKEKLRAVIKNLDAPVDQLSAEISTSGGVAAIIDGNTHHDDVVMESCDDASLSS